MTRMEARHESPTTPLLRLPQDIRRRIYRLVGVASQTPYPFNYDLHGPRLRIPLQSPGAHRGTDHHGSFHGLLLCCRHIYTEVIALLYSHNDFFIYYSGPGSLRPLLELTAPVLASLTSLKIVLAESSCHQRGHHYPGQTCCIYPNHSGSKTGPSHGCTSYHGHSLPLLTGEPRDHGDRSQALVDEWRAAMDHLSSGITPGRLDLALVCDIDAEHERAMDVATAILAPLQRSPLLKRCLLRLCRLPDARLSEAATEAALRARGIRRPYMKPPSAGGATLATLPREIRLRILEMTDLVTPSKEVWWSRHHPKYRWAALAGNSKCSDNLQRNCHFNECWHRPPRQDGITVGPRKMGCFCRRQHGAFSPFCTCWIPPGPNLFLICRTMCEEARLVFFSSNRFVIHDFKQCTPWRVPQLAEFDDAADLWYPYPFERLAISKFLREVVPTHCLAYLRFLELVFPPYRPPTWPDADHRAMRDWHETVAWLQDKANVPVLALRFIVVEIDTDAPAGYRIPMNDGEGGDIHDGHLALMEPLKALAERSNGLTRFSADLNYPWRWTEYVLDKEGQPGHADWLRDGTVIHNRRVERYVLGDRYDTLRGTNAEPAQSHWQHVHYRHSPYMATVLLSSPP